MIAMIVVQFGFAMIPALPVLRDRLRVDLGDHQRDVGLHPEGGGVVHHHRADAHAAAANSLMRDAPAENRAMSIPLNESFERSSTGRPSPANFNRLPTDRSGRKKTQIPDRELPPARICGKTHPPRRSRRRRPR